jgi:hypothetical protein
MNPRVLLIAPTSDKKHYCKDEWLKHIQSLTYTNYDIFICDNSEDPEYYVKEFIEKGINCYHLEPKGHVVEYISHSQQILIEYAKGMKYDYVFMCESDVFPPLNIIEYLLTHERLVVTAPYFINYRDNHPTVCVQEIEPTYISKQSMLLSGESVFNRWDGELHKVFSCGIGCTLIDMQVFNYINFRSAKKGGEYSMNESVFSDTYFYKDLQDNQIPAFMDTSVICEHRWSDWNKHNDFILQ